MDDELSWRDVTADEVGRLAAALRADYDAFRAAHNGVPTDEVFMAWVVNAFACMFVTMHVMVPSMTAGQMAMVSQAGFIASVGMRMEASEVAGHA